MRTIRVLVPVVFVLLALTMLPLGHAQPLITQTAAYLPVAFKVNDLPLLNGDFEARDTGWQFLNGAFTASGGTAHGGRRYAYLGGEDIDNEGISQRVRVPFDSPYLVFWYNALSSETDCTHDIAYILVNDQQLDTISEFCADQKHSSWRRRVVDLRAYVDQPVQLSFIMNTNKGGSSHWSIDDVTFVATP